MRAAMSSAKGEYRETTYGFFRRPFRGGCGTIVAHSLYGASRCPRNRISWWRPRGRGAVLLVLLTLVASSWGIGASTGSRVASPDHMLTGTFAGSIPDWRGSSRAVGSIALPSANSIPPEVGTVLAVQSTLALWNNTSIPGNFQASAPEFLRSAAYDPVDNLIFVASTTYSAISPTFANVVSTFNATTGLGLEVIGVGGDKVGGLSFDPADKTMYVATAWPGPGQLLSINSTTLKVQLITNLSGEADGLAYVPSTGQFYVAVSDGVDIVNVTTGILSNTISLATYQSQVTFDPANGDVYVMRSSPSGSPTTWNLTVIDPQTAAVVARLPGGWQGNLVYAPTDDDLYGVQTIGGGSPPVTSVLSPQNKYVANVSMGSSFVANANALVFDNQDDTVYVTSGVCGPTVSTGGLIGINASTNLNQGCTGNVLNPAGAAFASSSGRVYVTAGQSDGGDTHLWWLDPSTSNWTRETVGYSPTGMAYVPQTGLLFVADNWGGNLVSVVNVSSDSVVATVQVGQAILSSETTAVLPDSLVYDSVKNVVYVTENAVLQYQDGWLQEINVSTLNVTTLSKAIPSSPSGLVLDANHSRLYVTSDTGGEVMVFNTSSGGYVTSVKTGGEPRGPALDSAHDLLIVPNTSTGNVTVVNTSTDGIIANVSVGGQPSAAFFDPATGLVEVANGGRIDLINPSSGSQVGTISGFRAVSGFAFDAARDRVYVSDELGSRDAANVTILNASTDSVAGWTPTGSLCAAIAVDPSTGAVFAALEGSGSIMTLLPRSGPQTFSIVAPVNSMGVAEGPYGSLIRFTALGLGPDTDYQIAFDEYPGALGTSFGSQVSGFTTNLTGAFTGSFIAPGSLFSGSVSWYVDVYEYGYFALPTTSPSTGLFNVTSATVTANPAEAVIGHTVNIAGYGLAPSEPYFACFEGAGPYVGCLPSSVTFSADADGNLPGGVQLTVPGALNQEMVVSDAFTGIPVAVGQFYAQYPVLFTESGLPAGANWSADLGQNYSWSTSSTLGFLAPSGPTSFEVYGPRGFTASPQTGSINISQYNLTVSVGFQISSVAEFAVTFTESGLPSASTWWITLNRTTLSSISNSIEFQVAPGTYSYSVSPVAGYTANPSSGRITVSQNTTVPPIAFVPVPTVFIVTFMEGGLPTGALWSVTLDSTTESSSTTTLAFSEPDGNYSYTVVKAGNYTATPSTGTVRVSGQDVRQGVTFAPSPPACCAPSGITSLLSVITGFIVLLLIIATVVGIVRRSRRGQAPPPPPTAHWGARPAGYQPVGPRSPRAVGSQEGPQVGGHGSANFCARCGAPATPGGRFCLGCGAPL